MAGPLGVSWLVWFAVAVNFTAPVITTLSWRRRIKAWDKARAEWDATTMTMRQYDDAFEKLLGFTVMLANVPDGVTLSPAWLREQARALIPPGVKYDVKVVTSPPDTRVH